MAAEHWSWNSHAWALQSSISYMGLFEDPWEAQHWHFGGYTVRHGKCIETWLHPTIHYKQKLGILSIRKQQLEVPCGTRLRIRCCCSYSAGCHCRIGSTQQAPKVLFYASVNFVAALSVSFLPAWIMARLLFCFISSNSFSLFLSKVFTFLVLWSIHLPIPHCQVYYRSRVRLEVKLFKYSDGSFSKKCSIILSLHLQINFRINLSFHWKDCWVFIQMALKV